MSVNESKLPYDEATMRRAYEQIADDIVGDSNVRVSVEHVQTAIERAVVHGLVRWTQQPFGDAPKPCGKDYCHVHVGSESEICCPHGAPFDSPNKAHCTVEWANRTKDVPQEGFTPSGYYDASTNAICVKPCGRCCYPQDCADAARCLKGTVQALRPITKDRFIMALRQYNNNQIGSEARLTNALKVLNAE